MNTDVAQQLYTVGRAHGLSSNLLYEASIGYAEAEGLDVEVFPFNGTFSLSVHYLLGLGLELMLKAAIVASGGPSDHKSMRKIGHDLVAALDAAEAHGFKSEAPNLRDVLEVLCEPYQSHWFRYERPEKFPLPGDWAQVLALLTVLDDELRTMIGPEAETRLVR